MCMFSKIKYVSGQMYGLKSAGVASGRAHVCGWWASVPSWRFLTKTPVLEASASRHTRWPRAVWPGRALCSCLAGNSSEGQRCLLQCSVPHEPELLWHLSPCCHWPQVCLFITPAVPRAAWARGVIDLFTRRFPCGCRVVARTFIFCCGRWQRGCVCVCVPAQGTESQSSLCLGPVALPLSRWGEMPACLHRTSYRPVHCFIFFFSTEKPERWWRQDQLSL